MEQVTATAPTRIDLAGGTLDLWPLHRLIPKAATFNVAVDVPAKAEVMRSHDLHFRITSTDQKETIEGNWEEVCGSPKLPLLSLLVRSIWPKELGPINLKTSARAPAGSGIGGSSSLAIATASALFRLRRRVDDRFDEPTDQDLVRYVQDLECQVIRAPTGTQDYWAPLRGSCNAIFYEYGRNDVQTFSVDTLIGFEEEVMLVYSGRSRDSAMNNWDIFKSAFDGNKAVLDLLTKIGEQAERCCQAALGGDLEEIYERSQAEWSLRCKLWPGIETAETKRICLAANNTGARFARVCGAGGGGVLSVICPEDRRADVHRAVSAAGGQVLEAGVSRDGLQITEQ